MAFEPDLPPIRNLILPDPGWVFVDADFDRADAQIVAWSANEPELKRIMQEGIDVHSENAAWVHALSHIPVSRQKMKSGVHLCLTEDHEVLTRKGWLSITDKPNELLCWDMKSNALSFLPISNWFDFVCTTDLLEWDDFSFSQKVTYDHTLPYKTDDKGLKSAKAIELPSSARLPKSGVYVGGLSSITADEVRLLCAIQADGSKSKLQWCFHLKKQRKITRLHSLLEKLNIEYVFSKYADGTSRTAFTWLDVHKRLGPYIFHWSQEAIATYVEEAIHWDGHQGTTSATFTTVDQDHSLWFSTLVHLCGKASQGGEHGLGYTVSVNNRPFYRHTPPIKTHETVRLLCPKTPTGFFLIRRHNVISITGNTNYGGKANTLANTLGITKPHAAAFQMHWFKRFPGVKRWHEDTKLKLRLSHQLRNVWGFRRFYFERLNTEQAVDQVLPQALAWLGQSGVAIAINHAMRNVRRTFPRTDVRLKLQVHDSLLLAVRQELCPAIFPDIIQAMKVRIPFDDPLYIPVSLKWSDRSWGDVHSWDPHERPERAVA